MRGVSRWVSFCKASGQSSNSTGSRAGSILRYYGSAVAQCTTLWECVGSVYYIMGVRWLSALHYGVPGPNLDRHILDRTNPRQTKPRHDQTQTRPNLDRTYPRHGHILDTDISQTRHILDRTIPRHGQNLDTDISQTNFFFFLNFEFY